MNKQYFDSFKSHQCLNVCCVSDVYMIAVCTVSMESIGFDKRVNCFLFCVSCFEKLCLDKYERQVKNI